LLALIIINGCANLDTIDTVKQEKDRETSWRTDPFMQRTTKVIPIVSKTVILSDDKNEEEKK
jgi:hypothetical protein